MAMDNDQNNHKSDDIDSLEEISLGQENGDLASGMDSKLLERLSLAKSKRFQAQASRQQVAKEIEQATRELYKNLILEGERALEEANHAKTEAHLLRIEVQKELEHARVTRAEADAYHEKIKGEIGQYAQDGQEARAIKAEALANREQLLSDVRQQAENELAQAKDSIDAADSYCEHVLAGAQLQAEAIISEAVSTAEREGNQVKQRSLLESKKILAQVELIKVAAQDELEAQKLDAQSAALQAESQNVLRLADTKLESEIPDKELNLAKFGLDIAEAKLENEIPDQELNLAVMMPEANHQGMCVASHDKDVYCIGCHPAKYPPTPPKRNPRKRTSPPA